MKLSVHRLTCALVLTLVCATSALADSAKSKIGVIGSGSLGGTVGRAWVKAGHQVMFSSRHPEELRAEITALGPLALVGTPKEAARFGQVILVALPYSAIPAIGRDLADDMRGKVVIDASNPTFMDGKLMREATQDGVGATSARLLPGTRLVRGFSAVNATAIDASANGRRTPLAIPIASDDAGALKVATQLVRDAGSVPVVTGNLASSRVFEDGTPIDQADTDEATLRKMLNLHAK